MENEQIIILGFVIYLGLALAYSTYTSKKIDNWPFIIGKLLVAKVSYINAIEKGSAWSDVKYEYEVRGKLYVGTRLSTLLVSGQVAPKIEKQLAKIQYVSGDQVKVFYDKKDPSKSYLVKETWFHIFS